LTILHWAHMRLTLLRTFITFSVSGVRRFVCAARRGK
jgi:hypothetical protein